MYKNCNLKLLKTGFNNFQHDAIRENRLTWLTWELLQALAGADRNIFAKLARHGVRREKVCFRNRHVSTT